MEWSDISSAVAKYAPMVATTLSSPLGAAIGAGTIIANMFGVEATPDSVMDYITNNPEKAQEKISVFEMVKEQNRHDEHMAAIEFQNVDSARKNSQTINASPIDNAIKMKLVNTDMWVLYATLGAIIGAMFYDKPIDSGLIGLLGMVLGYAIKSLGEKCGFYFGTSLSSQKKDAVIAGKNN